MKKKTKRKDKKKLLGFPALWGIWLAIGLGFYLQEGVISLLAYVLGAYLYIVFFEDKVEDKKK
jgi:Na+/H+ antiporter NhaB